MTLGQLPFDLARADPTAIVGHDQPGHAVSPYELDPDAGAHRHA